MTGGPTGPTGRTPDARGQPRGPAHPSSAGAENLDARLRELAAQPVAVPSGLASRTLGRLRRGSTRETVEIASRPHGRDTVSTSVLGQVARRAATGVDAVREVSVVVRVLPTDAGADDRLAPAPGGGVAIDLHLTAELGPSLPLVADRVRASVAADVRTLTGVHVRRIDVTVDDVV